MERLTDRQREILKFIEAYAVDHGMPPSIRDISDQFHIYPHAVQDHLRALERKGYIERSPHKSRAVRLTHKHSPNSRASVQAVPIVGRIAAGTPILAVENVEGGFLLDRKLFQGGEAFAVEVNGDSMIEAHILDGDYVILRKQTTADKGDVVAVLMGEEVTLKRFYPRGKEIELRPANQRLKPIRMAAHKVRVLGKMVGLVRRS